MPEKVSLSPSPSFLHSSQGDRLAYHAHAGKTPSVIFLGGYMSDMSGTKAVFLDQFCKRRGQSFLRLDYSGHGESGGDFLSGTLSKWTSDALDVIHHAAPPPWVIVGSSMGGWIMLNISQQHPEKIAALMGIAAAPDFTLEIEKQLTPHHHQQLEDLGYFEEPAAAPHLNPYRFSKSFLEDGRRHQHLNKPIPFKGPFYLLQGRRDAEVPPHISEKIKNLCLNTKVEIRWIEDGDHRLSRPEDLKVLGETLTHVLDEL